ncbi:iron ABC transporter permease [Amycolatopsis sp. EV170708-02-1]|uniref:ABC transporter permease n=1 Tax=Amycolatopsis sp. EV170708-02-1 TaxID=2919322 RepID=UPI001F0C16BF|nr:iron ABC transporter permease [Amycolatopsis sp. EV170708-02-1]UMP00114.1 iron ABC transporter permease [Amycolatopsis sp. EV170708-02-1]
MSTQTLEPAPESTSSSARRRLSARATSSDRFIYFLAAPVLFVLLLFVVVPMGQTMLASVDGGAADNYASFLDGASGEALLLSVGTSLASVLSCGLVGTVLAILLARFDFPGRRVLEVVAVLPMALPPLIGAVSFVLLYSETGIVPRALAEWFGLSPADTAVTGVAGVLLVHTFTMYPFFYLSVSAGLAGLDPSLEAAAANLGAGRARVWRTVILPMLTPALVSGALLTFMISMASFTAPQLYNVPTLTMQIVSTRTSGNEGLAAAQATVLSLVSIVFLVSMRWYQGRRVHRSLSKGSQLDRTVTRGPARIAALVGSALLTVVLMAPILVIVLVSLSVDASWTTQVLPERYTFDNFTGIFTDPGSLLPISVSVQMSLLATGVAIVIGAIAAWVVARWKRLGGTVLDIMVMLPWALPGTVIGVNLITAFNEPQPGNLGLTLVGTLWILPAAYFVRYVPLIFRSTGAALDQISPSLEEAARNLGAGPVRVLRTVTFPLVARGVLAGALLAFIDGVGEYVASVVIYPAGLAPMSVEIYNRIYSSQFGSAAAYGTLQIVLILVVLIVSNRLKAGRRDSSGAALTAAPAS